MKFIIALAIVAGVLGTAAHVAVAAGHGPVPKPVDYAAQIQRAADEAAGRPVVIRCDTAESVAARVGYALAYVVLDGSSVLHIGPTVCQYLQYPSTPTFGGGVLVVLHEAFHLRYNSVDEGATECRALRAFPGVVRRYFPRLNARALAYGASRVDALMPEQYHGASC